jgi:hypothetical protein
MGLFGSSSKTTARRTSIIDYQTRLNSSIADPSTDEKARTALGDEKARSNKMTEKMQKRWVDFKLGNGWKGKWCIDATFPIWRLIDRFGW